jgi:hypothetical protein
MTTYSKYIDLQAIFDGYEYNGDKVGDDFQDELHDMIDNYIVSEDEDIVKKIVHKYGVFKAIKDYTCEYGEFHIDPDLSFLKTYGTLAYYIVDDYIRNNMSIITDYLKENNMSKEDTDTEE